MQALYQAELRPEFKLFFSTQPMQAPTHRRRFRQAEQLSEQRTII